MAHIVEDNVRESSTTTGTASFALGGALNTGRTFSSVCADGDTVHYAIHHETLNEWEVGLGTYETTGNLLLRTTPLKSSNAGAAVNFTAGSKRVELILPGSLINTVIYGLQGGAASTAEALGGTVTNKALTPDANAALWEKGADNSGGATITLGDGYQFDLITSTTTITALAFTTDKAGRMALLRFTTARQVTHNGTSLISPTGANLLMSPGECLLVESLGSGNFRIIEVLSTVDQGRAVASLTTNGSANGAATNLSFGSYTIPANTLQVGSVWEFYGYFTFLHTAAATPTLTLELLINGAVVDSCVLTPIATAGTWSGEAYGLITCRSTGGSGTVMANCRLNSSIGTATGTASNDGSTSTATDTVDTTQNRSIEMRIRMTTAVASNTLTTTQGYIRKVR